MVSRLYIRMALATCMLFIMVGGALVYTTARTSHMHALEVTQRVNRDIALHAAEDMPLLAAGGINEPAIQDLMHHVMFINPIVEVYLLDTRGNIMSHALPYGTVLRDRVNMLPLHDFMAGTETLPIFGEDPRSETGKKIFSVSPIEDDGAVVGYVYTVLNGQSVEGVEAALGDNYNLRMGTITVIGSLLVALLAGTVVFFLMTRRLQSLADTVRAYREDLLEGRMALPTREPARDEIDELTTVLAEMSQRIERQFSTQEEIDRNRRELIANVSHDLRTPIASIQGYLETILIKTLSNEEQTAYLETAHRSSIRLNHLIEELFELSRLESKTTEPRWETFPVMDLIQDIVHEQELLASEKGISLAANSNEPHALVCADIRMIHRVLENLIQNAIRHTPAEGVISVNVISSRDGVRVEVADTGDGIASHDIPHIFDRFYRPDTESPDKGNGLGLAIVKRIIELHESTIAVESKVRSGTRFSFTLAASAGT